MYIYFQEWNDFLLMRPSEVTIQLDWVKQIGSRLHDRINLVSFEVSLYSYQFNNDPGELTRAFRPNTELYISLNKYTMT